MGQINDQIDLSFEVCGNGLDRLGAATSHAARLRLSDVVSGLVNEYRLVEDDRGSVKGQYDGATERVSAYLSRPKNEVLLRFLRFGSSQHGGLSYFHNLLLPELRPKKKSKSRRKEAEWGNVGLKSYFEGLLAANVTMTGLGTAKESYGVAMLNLTDPVAESDAVASFDLITELCLDAVGKLRQRGVVYDRSVLCQVGTIRQPGKISQTAMKEFENDVSQVLPVRLGLGKLVITYSSR
jgi:hypothetical protein